MSNALINIFLRACATPFVPLLLGADIVCCTTEDERKSNLGVQAGQRGVDAFLTIARKSACVPSQGFLSSCRALNRRMQSMRYPSAESDNGYAPVRLIDIVMHGCHCVIAVMHTEVAASSGVAKVACG